MNEANPVLATSVEDERQRPAGDNNGAQRSPRYTREDFLETLVGEDPRSYIADHFAKYANTIHLARFLFRYEMMKLIENVHGSIVECGVKNGDGIAQFWHLKKMLEPHTVNRLVFGFDTFEGFPSVHPEKDNSAAKIGDEASPDAQEILSCLRMQALKFPLITHDGSSVLEPRNWIVPPANQQVSLIKGDFMLSGPGFLEEHPHLVIALLYLDFDLYEPTKLALEIFASRMPKGAVIVFDELNSYRWPGETHALLETFGIHKLRLRRFRWIDSPCYAVIE